MSTCASSSSSSKLCYNSECKELKAERPRKGWRLRNGDFAELCDQCFSAYENGRFCETFHKNASGWRCCESCGKGVHCGCIVSSELQAFALLDPGGIECSTCARKNDFLVGMKFNVPVTHLSNIKQGENETLKSYLNRFHAERAKVTHASEESIKILLITGVQPQSRLWNELQQEEDITLDRCYNITEKHMRLENSLAALKESSTKSNVGSSKREDRSGKRNYDEEKREQKRSRHETTARRDPALMRRYDRHTPLNEPIGHICAVSEHTNLFSKPPPLKGDPAKRDQSKYCRYHRDYGHLTDECRHLKDAIEDLIQRGYLKEFVNRVNRTTQKELEHRKY